MLLRSAVDLRANDLTRFDLFDSAGFEFNGIGKYFNLGTKGFQPPCNNEFANPKK